MVVTKLIDSTFTGRSKLGAKGFLLELMPWFSNSDKWAIIFRHWLTLATILPVAGKRGWGGSSVPFVYDDMVQRKNEHFLAGLLHSSSSRTPANPPWLARRHPASPWRFWHVWDYSSYNTSTYGVYMIAGIMKQSKKSKKVRSDPPAALHVLTKLSLLLACMPNDFFIQVKNLCW